MLVIRFWKQSDQNGAVSPFGGVAEVLTERASTERVFQSLSTWCSQSATVFRVGCCDDRTLRTTRGSLSPDALLSAVAVDGGHSFRRSPGAWRYLHVVHRTMHREIARRLRGALVDLGHGVGACENSPHDPAETLERGPYYIYVLTGQQVDDRPPAPEAEEKTSASLFDLAEL